MQSDPLQPLLEAVSGLSVQPGSRVLVAVSGGPDSVALALAFCRMAATANRRWDIHLAHINHALRGAESESDEQFVIALGCRLDVPVHTTRIDVTAFSRAQKLSLETAARQLRYEKLRAIRDDCRADWIALGHHMDDQAETIMHNLARGTGLHGLAGMSPVSGELLRPFLKLRSQTIVSVLKHLHEPYRMDRSNESTEPRRNLLRQRYLPLLAEAWPDVTARLSRTAEIVHDADDYLHREALAALGALDVEMHDKSVSAGRPAFRTLAPTLQSEIVREMVFRVLGTLTDFEDSHTHGVVTMIGSNTPVFESKDQLPRGLAVSAGIQRFSLLRAAPAAAVTQRGGSLDIPGHLQLLVGGLKAKVIELQDDRHLERLVAVIGPNHALCDADALGTRLEVRFRHSGDRIPPLGMDGSKSLQNLFIDRKIPQAVRSEIPIVCIGDAPVWIPGVTLARKVAVTALTHRVAHLSFHPLQ